jgi:four helix bundle protein
MNENKIRSFEDLIVWQKAMNLAITTYQLIEENPSLKKDFGLKDQFKRAALSISNNIAEGYEYSNNADFYRYLRMAKGSCGETRNMILFVTKLQFISEETSQPLLKEIMIIGGQIGSLMKSVKEKISSGKKTTRNA